jgi:S1-C subfamily serine protease
MRMRQVAAMVLGVALATEGGLAHAQELGEEARIRLAEMLHRSTVTVATGPGTVGSGFVAGAGVQVVTNLHVVAGSPNVELRFSDGQSVPATVVATDPAWDLALIEPLGPVDSPPPPLRLGDSDRARVGQSVLAMGAPFGL